MSGGSGGGTLSHHVAGLCQAPVHALGLSIGHLHDLWATMQRGHSYQAGDQPTAAPSSDSEQDLSTT